ncbi:hypothetical protein Tco_0691316 [Tanacetum coccineum]
MESRTVSNFKIPGLLLAWQTLCTDILKCLLHVLRDGDQQPVDRYANVILLCNNIHVDYAELMLGRQYLPQDAYHNLQDDDIMKNIFNSGRNKNKVGMRIPAWMITEEMKLTEHYKMYAEVFGLDVPLTQSQSTESTQGTHRILSAPRSPNPATETAESSVPKRSTAIHFRLPSRQSARLTPPVPVPTAEKANEMILQDMIQKLVVKTLENVDDSSPPRHDDTFIPGTRLEPKSDKESLEVEIVQEKEEETTKDTKVEPDKDIPMEEGRKGSMLVATLLVKRKSNEEVKMEVPAQVRRSVPVYLAEGLIRKSELKKDERLISKLLAKNSGHSSCSSSTSFKSSLFLNNNILYLAMKADPLLQQQDIVIWLALQMKFEKIQVPQTACRFFAVRTRDQDDPHDDAHPEGENSAKRQKTSEYQEKDDEFDFWNDSYASDLIMEIPTKQRITRQSLEETIFENIDEALFIRSSVIWERVYDFQLGIESYQQKINLTALTITFPGIEEYDVFSIVYEPAHGIIYANSKKEKRVMRPSDDTLSFVCNTEKNA